MPRKKEMMIDAHIGARLRLRRLMLGMSQEALGERLSLTFQQVQKYEKGTNRIVASRLYELARVLDVPVQYFFDGLEDDTTQPPTTGMSEDIAKAPQPNAESASVAPYLNFVSSNDGLQLNRAFLQIESEAVRRNIISMIQSIAVSEKEAKK